jgi:hypothetical protein
MEGPLQAWVRPMLHQPQESSLSPGTVDLGGSLAVASRGLYATGVSTDLNGVYLSNQTECLLTCAMFSYLPELWRANWGRAESSSEV